MNRILVPFIKDPKREYYPTEHIHWCQQLREHYTDIKREYLDFISHHEWNRFRDIDPNQGYVDTGNIPWGTIILRIYNKDTHKKKYFPNTCNLLQQIPECSLAMFSILPPHKKLPIHYGPSKSVLRYHLGLIVPQESSKCYLSVNGKKYHWKEGQDILFDDTLSHYACNDSNQLRVVLFLDIARSFENPLIHFLNRQFLLSCQYNETVQSIVKKIDYNS
jgi:beta-hydroxylase